MEAYQVIKSEKKFEGKIVEVFHDEISLPNGKTTLREIVVRGKAAAVIAVDDDHQLVFVRQYRHPLKKMILEIPAGMLENSQEDPQKCALRELEEETGYKARKISFIAEFSSAIGFCTELVSIYLAEGLEAGVQHLDEDEFISVEKYSLEQAVEMVFQNKIFDSKTMFGILAYQEFLRRKSSASK